jgi:hypothetical protein
MVAPTGQPAFLEIADANALRKTLQFLTKPQTFLRHFLE